MIEPSMIEPSMIAPIMIAPVLSAEEASAIGGAVAVDLGTNGDGVAPADAHRAGHVPGAVFIDLDTWLAAPPTAAEGRHPLPDPEVFAEGMRRAGIADTDVVVAYDRVGGVFAARLVWLLRATGHDAALLDGGMAGWPAAPEAGEVQRPRATFRAVAVPDDRLAGIEEVAHLGGGAVLLDAREGHRFRGEPHPLDAVNGHIPGSRSLPCRENLDPGGRLLPRDVLRERLRAVGVTAPDTPVISSCGSGVTACHNLLVLEHTGLGTGRLYPGSWSQWGGSGRPIETG